MGDRQDSQCGERPQTGVHLGGGGASPSLTHRRDLSQMFGGGFWLQSEL